MADVDALLAGLTLDEKAALTAGADFWSTVEIPRLDIPKVRVTDGPNGARGAAFGSAATPSVCTPCGSALGATWSPSLVERVGALIARDARALGCHVLLAPTLNLHRSPLAGRNFECYSEDPLLAGRIATGYVRGVQSEGVIATVKHFVGNDAEFERYSTSSVIDERALREVYLVPFELAIRDGGALAVMTAYNRVNGRWVTESPGLLTGLLRNEWGFDGIVITDWLGVAGTVESSRAGLDLEMPGPGRAYGSALAEAVTRGDVAESTVDDMVRRLLRTFDRVGALDRPLRHEPASADRPEDRALMREAAAEAMVLLRNDGVLPLNRHGLRSVAVIGPNADEPSIMGGGSAQLTPHAVATPVHVLRELLGSDVQLVHEPGCSIRRSASPLGRGAMTTPGFTLEVLDRSRPDTPVTHSSVMATAEFLFLGPPPGATADWAVRVTGTVTPTTSGQFTLTLAQLGRARVFVDGELLLDGEADPPPPGGTDFMGFGSTELGVERSLGAGEPFDLTIEYDPRQGAGLFAAKAGFRSVDDEELFDRAVSAARDADLAVLVVGTTGEWERETFDRSTMQLPGRQDELVRRVAEVNPRTVVVVNAGSPVDLGWSDEVNAIIQCWFGGQDFPGAVGDVLVGLREPGGRLPTTIPSRVEHNPAFDNFPGENGEVRYGEGIFMGYRGYQHRALPVRYPFGHGLGYSTFTIGEPRLPAPTHVRGGTTTVSVVVTNTGARRGSEVVQLYVAPVAPRLARPIKELKAFAKVALDAGESATVDLLLDDRSFAYWDPGQSDWDSVRERLTSFPGAEAAAERRRAGWQVDAGRYELLVGRSAEDVVHTVAITIDD